MATTYTQSDVRALWGDVESDLRNLDMIQPGMIPSLVLGSRVHGVSNKLMVNGQNVWQGNLGGFTPTEAYRALRVMRNTLAIANT